MRIKELFNQNFYYPNSHYYWMGGPPSLYGLNTDYGGIIGVPTGNYRGTALSKLPLRAQKGIRFGVV